MYNALDSSSTDLVASSYPSWIVRENWSITCRGCCAICNRYVVMLHPGTVVMEHVTEGPWRQPKGIPKLPKTRIEFGT
jgi:hypothetical protein